MAPLLAPPRTTEPGVLDLLARYAAPANAPVACRCMRWRRGLVSFDGACTRCERGLLRS